MKFLLKSILAVNILVFPLIAQQSLKVTATLSKSEYLLGEPINIFFEYVNIGSATILAKNVGDVSVIVVNETGDTLKGNVTPLGFSPDDFDYLPGESRFKNMDLNEKFGISPDKYWFQWWFEPGYYYITIFVFSQNKQIEKKFLSFKVVEPTGDELLVLNKLEELLSNMHHKELPAHYDSLISIHNSFPNSVYSPLILRELSAIYRITLNDHGRGESFSTELVEKYPWSSAAQAHLGPVLHYMKTKQERIEFLRKVRENSKGSKMEKVYDKKLREELAK